MPFLAQPGESKPILCQDSRAWNVDAYSVLYGVDGNAIDANCQPTEYSTQPELSPVPPHTCMHTHLTKPDQTRLNQTRPFPTPSSSRQPVTTFGRPVVICGHLSSGDVQDSNDTRSSLPFFLPCHASFVIPSTACCPTTLPSAGPHFSLFFTLFQFAFAQTLCWLLGFPTQPLARPPAFATLFAS